jgi:delta1-piperideine-2-carboxylate reductase
METRTNLAVGALHEQVDAILRNAGLNAVQAGAIARVIVSAERDGCKSHGIYRIEGVLRTIKAGKVRTDAVPESIAQDRPGIIRVSAGGGFAPAAIEVGVAALVESARACGIAAAAINDGAHFSALWPEIEALADQGLAGLAMCPSYATVAPTGGKSALLGTNPLAFGWPREGRPPYVFDIATSVVARGEIELHRRANKPLPEGWAVDAHGRPSTDPEAALMGAMLSFGGHKGSAIGTMIELLAGAMIGDLTSPEARHQLGTTTLIPTHGEIIIAFSPKVFAAGRPGNPLARAEALFEAIEGQGARLPSQRRFMARERSEREGISLSSSELDQLHRFKLGLSGV